MNGPFILPVRDIVHRPGEMREFELDVPVPEKWGEGLVAVAAGEPIDLSVRLESVHEGILVTADIATRYEGVCGRCLIDIAQPVEVEFQELFGTLEQKRRTSRFKTTTWILNLLFVMPSSSRFRSSRYVSRIAPDSTRSRARG